MTSFEHAVQRAGAYCQGLGGIPRVVHLTLGAQEFQKKIFMPWVPFPSESGPWTCAREK